MSVTRVDTKKDEKREKKKAELGICRIKDNQKNSTVGSGSLVRDFIDGQCCLVTTDEVVLPNTELKQLVLEFKKSNSNKVKVVELSKYASDIYRDPSGLVVIALNSDKSTPKTRSIFTHRPFSRGDGVDFTCFFCPIVVDTDPAKPFAVKEFQLKTSHDHKGCAVLSDASSGISCQSLREFKGTSFCQPHGAVVLNGKKEAVGVLYESDERISPIWFSQRSLGEQCPVDDETKAEGAARFSEESPPICHNPSSSGFTSDHEPSMESDNSPRTSDSPVDEQLVPETPISSNCERKADAASSISTNKGSQSQGVLLCQERESLQSSSMPSIHTPRPGAASITETSSETVDSGQAGDTRWSETSSGVVMDTILDPRGVLTEDSKEDAEVHEQVAELASEEDMGAGYLGGSKERSDDDTETEDDAEVIEVEPGAVVTREGTSWASKQWAVHLMLPPGAVSERTPIVVHGWKCSVRSPPLQEHEAITSNVVELSSANGQELKFNTTVKLSLSHSATDLQGYELVIKKLIDKETNSWEEVYGTRDIRCRQDLEDSYPFHMEIPDFFFPIAQADISECSTYAVVWRLKASPTYTITSDGGSFSHPDFPGVTVTIPENAVAPDAKFPMKLKVQEVPNEEFEREGKFLGPVLRIKCFDTVQFSKPVTVQLPISLREHHDLNLDPTACHVRVLFLKSDNDHKEWIEITDDLLKPPSLDGKFVRFLVERFSGYSHCVERRNENSRVYGQSILNVHNSLIFDQPRLTVFFAYFRPDLVNILRLICCPSHLKGKVAKKLEKRGITPVYSNSKKDMIPGQDMASVFVSEGICPYIRGDMEEIYLRLLEDNPDDAELEVCFLSGRNVARVEFYGISQEARAPLLCRLHLGTPNHGTDSSKLCELTQQPRALMEGSPTDDVLERLSIKLSDDWRTLGRRLTFGEWELQEFDKGHVKISEKAYYMLLAWKQKGGSDATYRVLNQALCHTRVNRRDLAQEFCCSNVIVN